MHTSSNHRRNRLRLTLVLASALLAACSSTQTSTRSVPAGQSTAAPTAVTTTAVTQQPADSQPPSATTAPTATTASTATTAPPASPSAVASGLTALTVESTVEQYFVLYVRPDLGAATELPVAIALGQAGSTTVTDGRSTLPETHYRVAAFSTASPEDVDGDGVDDLTELADPVNANPLNPAAALDPSNGAVIIPDRAAFEAMSYQGDEVARDGYLAGLEFVKFWIIDTNTDHPSVYFMNTENFRAHPMFAEAVGLPAGRGTPGTMRGDVVYNPDAIAPDGTAGTYRFAFQPNDAYSFQEIALAYETLSASMPVLTNNLLYYPFPNTALPRYEAEKAEYDAYRVPVLLD